MFDSLPEELEIRGKKYKIDTDFRTWIKFQSIFNSDKSDEQKTADLFGFLQTQGLPFFEESVKAVLQFFEGGSANQGNKSNKISYDFDIDGALIFSAFLTQYATDLTTDKIHWWKFKAMFSSLDDNHMISKIMWARTTDIKGMSKETKQYIKKLKETYPLQIKTRPKTAEEHIQEMKDKVKRAYERTKVGG